VRELEQTLSEDERERARRLRFERDRRRFVVARGTLRGLLARYTALDPAALRFQYGRRGKPALAAELNATGLRFNLSHSHELALYAVARGRELGIDVEQRRPDRAEAGIAERFFSPRELEALRALPTERWTEAFFTCWTRKEAYIKAKGAGFGIALDQFDVTVAPGQPAVLLATRQDPPDAARWSLHDLHPGDGYAGALAMEGDARILRYWQWKHTRPR
jgi:4'-phosphopantetheinyl transferase